METHVKVLGVLYIALSAVAVLMAIVLLFGVGSVATIVGANADPDEAALAVPIIGMIGTGLIVLLLILALPGFITGYGLLQHRPWARIIGIVLSAVGLLGFPIWTVLGVYGLWVLLSKETEQLFERSVSIQT